MGTQLLPNVPDPEQIVARLAEVYLPGVLYVVFVGAIISAILSVVHSALHAPAAQISHNLIERWSPTSPTGASSGRCGSTVLALSIVAFAISLSSEGIKELVETASAFGSAGVFVATLFALFTRFGGPLSAYASVGAGHAGVGRRQVWLGLATPYLLGLLAALVGLCRRSLIDSRRRSELTKFGRLRKTNAVYRA